jgi:hypothetical protein
VLGQFIPFVRSIAHQIDGKIKFICLRSPLSSARSWLRVCTNGMQNDTLLKLLLLALTPCTRQKVTEASAIHHRNGVKSIFIKPSVCLVSLSAGARLQNANLSFSTFQIDFSPARPWIIYHGTERGQQRGENISSPYT